MCLSIHTKTCSRPTEKRGGAEMGDLGEETWALTVVFSPTMQNLLECQRSQNPTRRCKVYCIEYSESMISRPFLLEVISSRRSHYCLEQSVMRAFVRRNVMHAA